MQQVLCRRYYRERGKRRPFFQLSGRAVQRFFPVTPLVKVEQIVDQEYIEKLIYKRQRALLMEVKLENVRLIDEMWGDLYLTKDKCDKIENGKYYNGRILSADSLVCYITEIDYMIIKEVYRFDFTLIQWYKASKGKIPQCIIDFIIQQYKYKTELKGLTGDFNETLYMKSKNRLNGIYGLFATAPVHEEYIYDKRDREFHYGESTDEEKFAKAKTGYWLPYQFGIWCTALARYELYKGIKNVYKPYDNELTDFIYCDTDSVKYIGHADWTAYNAEKIRLSTESGAYATDAKGKTHYMGVYESEGVYDRFKSCGAKKYAYEKNGRLSVTIAGVQKKEGSEELSQNGGLDALVNGFVFRNSGGLAATYNDVPQIDHIIVDGEVIPITANLYLSKSEYTVGDMELYKRILNLPKIVFDRLYKNWYNEEAE